MKTCGFCGIEYKYLGNHSRYCKLNPNRLDKSGKNNPMYGKMGGNQFTKATREGRVIQVSDETKEKISKANKEYIWSEERKARHSKLMLDVVKRNPDSYSSSNVSGRVKTYEFDGMKFKGKWELKVAKCLKSSGIKYTNIIEPIEYIWNNSTHLYFPDFYLEDYDLYLEVKGYERDRDLCKWNVLNNLLILKAKEISELGNIPISELLNNGKIQSASL